jgi:hypothetical protein
MMLLAGTARMLEIGKACALPERCAHAVRARR